MCKVLKLVWVATAFASIVASSKFVAAETVVVRLRSGREISATIHGRTDDARLWLQYGTESVSVIRPIRWQEIIWASHDGQPIGVPQLKQLALRGTPPEALSVAEPPAIPEPTATPDPTSAAEPAAGVATRVLRVPPAAERPQPETMAQRASRALGFAPPVRSVQFDAVLANWDGDVETDGLLLRLLAIDDAGNAATASGTLYVELVANRQRDFNRAPRQGGFTTDRIGRWTVQVGEGDFRQGAATVKLPFQAIHPEFDTDWFADGLVHVRFSVAGVGTFEHSLDGIRIRPFAPLRDARQLQSGRRFLPSERTGLGPRSAN